MDQVLPLCYAGGALALEDAPSGYVGEDDTGSRVPSCGKARRKRPAGRATNELVFSAQLEGWPKKAVRVEGKPTERLLKKARGIAGIEWMSVEYTNRT